MYGPGIDRDKPELHVPPNGRDRLAALGEQLGAREMFEDSFRLSEYREGEPFRAAGFELTPVRVPHYAIESYAFRVANESSVLAYSGDSGPSDALADLARDADLFVCEATLCHDEPEPRGHLSLEEALDAFHASGARRLLVTHRPAERGVGDDVMLAHDGLELDV
jgi:ribonuclease BN (tRNA processing enzyme)